jgi:hypothetical protein
MNSLWADGTPSAKMREFEFEIAELYYPLLSEEETQALKEKMINDLARISVFYSGNIKEINPPAMVVVGTLFGSLYARRPMIWPPIEAGDRGEWKRAQITRKEEGKIRFTTPNFGRVSGVYIGEIPIDHFVIHIPLHDLAEIFEKPRKSKYANIQNGYFEFEIGASPRYKTDYSEPFENDVGILVAGKISEIKNGVAKTPESDGKPLFDERRKLYTIGRYGYGIPNIQMAFDLTENIPDNLENQTVHYRNFPRLEQFSLIANARTGKGQAEFFLNEIKVNGKLFRIDARVGDDNYRPKANYCAFIYGIEFYPDREARYFRRPKDHEYRTLSDFWSGEEKATVVNVITDGDISPILAYEAVMAERLGEESMKDCKLLLDHAKHILTTPTKALDDEFDTHYQAIGKEYDRLSVNGFWTGETKDGEPDGKGFLLYPNGDREKVVFKDGKKTGSWMIQYKTAM